MLLKAVYLFYRKPHVSFPFVRARCFYDPRLLRFPFAAVVSDSYDIWNACEHLWGEELHDVIVERGKLGGTLVVRPDSGDPPEVVVKVTRHIRKRSHVAAHDDYM